MDVENGSKNPRLSEDVFQSIPAAIQNAWTNRESMVASLREIAASSSKSRRNHLHVLADEIANTRGPYELLGNPIALQIGLALSKAHDPNRAEVNDILDEVLTTHLPLDSRSQRLLTLLIYPLIVLVVCGVLLIGMCWLLVPTFESMFADFGLQLPVITRLMIDLSHAVRRPTFYVLLLSLLGGGIVFTCLRIGRPGNFPTPLARVRGAAFQSDRSIWADWAWHVSLLMKAGLNLVESISIAGQSSGREWLALGSRRWADELRAGRNPFAGVTHFRSQPCHLLSYALSNEVHPNADLIGEIAKLYWDRDRDITQSGLVWLPPILIMGVGLIVCFVILSLFSPLVTLISGLT